MLPEWTWELFLQLTLLLGTGTKQTHLRNPGTTSTALRFSFICKQEGHGGFRKARKSPSRSPLWTGPLPVPMHFHEQLSGVSRGRDAGVEQQVLVLSQVLGRGLLGGPSAVQQFPLQQG